MPASRNPEAPYSLDALPRPNLSIADIGYIQLMSQQYGRIEKPVPPDDNKTNKTCNPKTSVSNTFSGSKPVVTKSNAVDSSNIRNSGSSISVISRTATVSSSAAESSSADKSSSVDKSRSVDKSTVVNKATVDENPWFPKLDQTKTGYCENYEPKGETSPEPHQPVTASQDSVKPTIVTSKAPFDTSCRRSPTPPMATSSSPVANRKDRIPEVPAVIVHGPSDFRTASTSISSPNNAPTSVTDSLKSTPFRTSRSRSPQPNSRNEQASDSGTGITSHSSTSARTEQVPPRQPSASQLDPQGSSSPKQEDNKVQRKRKKRANNARRAEDVDNYVGDKSIEELVKFIEG